MPLDNRPMVVVTYAAIPLAVLQMRERTPK